MELGDKPGFKKFLRAADAGPGCPGANAAFSFERRIK